MKKSHSLFLENLNKNQPFPHLNYSDTNDGYCFTLAAPSSIQVG